MVDAQIIPLAIFSSALERRFCFCFYHYPSTPVSMIMEVQGGTLRAS